MSEKVDITIDTANTDNIIEYTKNTNMFKNKSKMQK